MNGDVEVEGGATEKTDEEGENILQYFSSLTNRNMCSNFYHLQRRVFLISGLLR